MLNAMKGKNKMPQKGIIRRLDSDCGDRLLQEVNFQLRPKGSAVVRQGGGGTTCELERGHCTGGTDRHHGHHGVGACGCGRPGQS